MPGHAGRAQAVDGGDEVEPGQDGGHPEHEGREHGQGDIGAGLTAEGDIDGPARVRRPGLLPGSRGPIIRYT